MNYLDYFPSPATPIESCIVGAGAFGRSYIAQAGRTPGLHARVAIDVDAGTAAACFRAVGIPDEAIAICATEQAVSKAWQAGKYIAANNLDLTASLPIDIVIEATGNPEAGARHCLAAITAGRHVVLVSKEVDSVVGPYLSQLARQHGCVVTPVDGDQPSLLIGLVTWAQRIGFTVLAAGKASEYDFVVDLEHDSVCSNGTTAPTPGLGSTWLSKSLTGPDLVKRRAEYCGAFAQHIVPDMCEMQIVANSADMSVDRADFHAPIAHISEIADLFAPVAEGGILSSAPVLDVFHCLRRADEVSAAGGVFVIVQSDDAVTWELLREKGHLVSRDGRRAAVFLPRHLLGLEAATSVFEAALHGRSTGAQTPGPKLDIYARARQALAAGSVLEMGGHHHTMETASAELHPAHPLAPESPVPFYLAANCRLARDVAAGSLVCLADIEVNPASTLLALRRKQDLHFFG